MHDDVLLAPILVADDDETDVFFLERRLRAAGVLEPVHHLGDGLEAIEWLQRLPPAGSELSRPWLLFLDLKMPRVNGFEVLSWMQERRLTEEMIVVVLSTSDDPRDMARVLELGAFRFLIKYPQPRELAEVAAPARQRAIAKAEAELRNDGAGAR